MALLLKGALCLRIWWLSFLFCRRGSFGLSLTVKQSRVSTCSKTEADSDTGKGTVQTNAKFTGSSALGPWRERPLEEGLPAPGLL